MLRGAKVSIELLTGSLKPAQKKAIHARIENGDIDPSFVVTHVLSLDDAPRGYEIFKNKTDGCIKVVLRP